ncbi:hypothetical protein AVL60_02035 [Kocuria palustris]|uniref:DUF3500 domain-containing protein n=1 Tax=Kocuria palustris PEL TaxID=1236550 RepID=M2YCM9_9MICC|nr:hypothetical protein C884_00547 [Kocuria palustris PEL]KUG55124.1 hypothetical protein AVL60_02035 [Kocuria palustris]
MGAAGISVAALLATTACGTVGQASDTSSDSAATSVSTSVETSANTSTTESSLDSSAEVQALAQAFADTLDDDQLAELNQDYSYENATNWSNFPQELLQNGMGGGPGGTSSSSGRVGLQISTLDDEQRAALEELMAAALGGEDNEGYDEVMAILAADDYLAENYGGTDYGSENYYIAFLGEVTDSGTWELQFGGHHLAVSNTYTDGELVSATPSFRGTEPTGEFTLDGETYDPLTQETDALSALAESLTEDQLAEAATDQSDLLLGPGQDGEFPEEEGVKVSDLSGEQQELVLEAIETYVDDLPEDEAAEYMATYESELEDTYVLFSGSTDFSTAGDYIRIDGPSVWIELAMQNGVATSEPHIHSVWRDSETDYAGLTEDSSSTDSEG